MSDESISSRIRVYEPQLNLDVHSYPLSLPANKPQDPQPSSRLISAFQKICNTPLKSASVAPLETVSASKSSIFKEKIKSTFQPKKKPQLSMTRSGSLSSMAKRWSLNKQKDLFEVKWSMSTNRKKPQQFSSEKVVRFSSLVSTNETYSKTDYDRQSDPDAICTSLTPLTAQVIKEELNAYKLHEMQVHEHSKVNTHFFI